MIKFNRTRFAYIYSKPIQWENAVESDEIVPNHLFTNTVRLPPGFENELCKRINAVLQYDNVLLAMLPVTALDDLTILFKFITYKHFLWHKNINTNDLTQLNFRPAATHII